MFLLEYVGIYHVPWSNSEGNFEWFKIENWDPCAFRCNTAAQITGRELVIKILVVPESRIPIGDKVGTRGTRGRVER
jgi:hypothetical protein